MGIAFRGAQRALPAAYYRGGTSRALMFKLNDLPVDRREWPLIFRSIIGSPDPNGRQLDGMGAGVSSLSKVCIVGTSQKEEVDVDYTVAAIGVTDSNVDFSSNCGNMAAAIGPFAVNSGQVKVKDGKACVRIHNTSTGKITHSHFLVKDGKAEVNGSFAIDGVAGTGAKIKLTFINPSGSKTGKMLPTGNVTDTLGGITVTCIDVGNPCILVQASDLGVEGSILPNDITAHPTLLARLESIRRKGAVTMGIAQDEQEVPRSIPKIALVSSPSTHTILSGALLSKEDCDVVIRSISIGQAHRTVPVTVAMAVAVASKLDGSIVERNKSKNPVNVKGITIGHSSGGLLVGVNSDSNTAVDKVTVFLTARQIMKGTVYWKQADKYSSS
ncbi:DUF453 domain protein [Lizonia empirigonia]|nr:DUF453 domain protein [Lizonia empirigonia]